VVRIWCRNVWRTGAFSEVAGDAWLQGGCFCGGGCGRFLVEAAYVFRVLISLSLTLVCVLRAEQSPYLDLIDVLHIRKSWHFVLLFVCWMLVGRLFCFEIGSRCLSAICFDWLWCFSGKPGVRWPYDLILKTGGPIVFHSRSGVSYLVQVWFWTFVGVLSMDRRLCSGGG